MINTAGICLAELTMAHWHTTCVCEPDGILAEDQIH